MTAARAWLAQQRQGLRRCFESCYNYLSGENNNSNNALGRVATRAGLLEGREESAAPLSHTSLPRADGYSRPVRPGFFIPSPTTPTPPEEAGGALWGAGTGGGAPWPHRGGNCGPGALHTGSPCDPGAGPRLQTGGVVTAHLPAAPATEPSAPPGSPRAALTRQLPERSRGGEERSQREGGQPCRPGSGAGRGQQRSPHPGVTRESR